MESGRRDQDTLGRAAELLVDRGRVYRHGEGRKYFAVHFFTRNVHEVRLIKKFFAGNYYRHGVGFLWIISSREGLKLLMSQVSPYMTDESSLNRLRARH
jgi:hypothetical protein